ncbi:hypothetical protein EJ08DRAFT_698743 [Tothia fuscella]|uniref:Uncharacterized protein n=1 Tax=Tothia fuscella TaxID=1048955 RepID=A0A9P4NNA0_9PEZI|nr:hypothetical protein EJ08DRAFT_698743 [Tothia fuscella]
MSAPFGGDAGERSMATALPETEYDMTFAERVNESPTTTDTDLTGVIVTYLSEPWVIFINDQTTIYTQPSSTQDIAISTSTPTTKFGDISWSTIYTYSDKPSTTKPPLPKASTSDSSQTESTAPAQKAANIGAVAGPILVVCLCIVGVVWYCRRK